jgi:hypothetical protein
MTQDTEQYRAGFEAWARDEGLSTARARQSRHGVYMDDYYEEGTCTAWRAWCAAMQQREASTEPSRYYMDHGVLHDRETGGHLWTQDQYDEQWRSMYKAGQEDAAAGYNMLTGKMVEAGAGALPDEAKDAARYRVLRINAAPADVAFSMGVECTRLRDDQAIEEMIDSLCDAAIEAHKRTGSGKGEEK